MLVTQQPVPASDAAFTDSGSDSQSRFIQSLYRCSLAFVLVLLIFTVLVDVRDAPNLVENDHRLAPSIAIAKGYKLYYPADVGPVLSTLYAPMTAIVYLPMAIFKDPAVAIRAGVAWTLILYFGPVVLLYLSLKSNGTPRNRLRWTAEALGLAAACMFLSQSLRTVSGMIHADAPALSFATLACLFGLSRRYRFHASENALLAGAFAALSVLSKQNMALFPLALGLWLFFFRNLRALGAYLAGGVGAAAIVLAGTILRLSSWQAFWLNTVKLPTSQPYQKILFFPALHELLSQTIVYALIPLWALILTIARRDSPAKALKSAGLDTLCLFLMLGTFLMPMSLMGRIKAGAGTSALAPSIFFFFLALMAIVASREMFSRSAVRALCACIFIFAVFWQAGPLAYSARPRQKVASSPTEVAYQYLLRHPGELYFPQLPLAALLAENRLYHFSWGLTDRQVAGYPLSKEHFLENIPAKARYCAVMPDWVPYWHIGFTPFQGEAVVSDRPELDNTFHIYRLPSKPGESN